MESKIKGKDVIIITYDVNSQDAEQIFELPNGINNFNWSCTALKVFSQYGTWLDIGYADGAYYGNLTYPDNTHLKFAPKVLGNPTKLEIAFFQK